MERAPFVYILASGFRGTLYIGVTSDLMRRVHEHRCGIRSDFPARYAVYRLVHFEDFADMYTAIVREKQLKRWHRMWKINLIEAKNPHWEDMAVPLGFEPLRERHRPPPGTLLIRHPELVSGSSLEARPASGR